MEAMKLVVVLTLLFFPFLLFSQSGKDYIVLVNNDTIFVSIIRIDKKMKSMVCGINGKKTRYTAKNLSGFKYDTLVYETGLVRLKKGRQYVFLRRIVTGKMNLYGIDMKTKEILWGNIREDALRFRWVYRAQKWAKKCKNTIYFYKKEYEAKDQFSKSGKGKMKDCTILDAKIQSMANLWTPSPEELVQFYNSNCK